MWCFSWQEWPGCARKDRKCELRRDGRRRARYRPRMESLEDRRLPAVAISAAYAGLAFNNGFPPDTNAAVGTNSIVETANQMIEIFNKSDGTPRGTGLDLSTFFYNTNPGTQTNLVPTPAPHRLSDPVVVWDDQAQRFIVGDQDINNTPNASNPSAGNLSTFDIAVSRSATPNSLTTADWWFYQVTTTENNSPVSQVGTLVYDADFPGNLGYNADALVFTLNMFPISTTIAASSSGVNLPQSTINVASTSGFQSSGSIFVSTTTGNTLVNYAGLTATSFTGCTGGVGTMQLNGGVVQAGSVHTTIAAGSDNVNLPQTTISVASTVGFAPSGSLYVQTSTAGVALVKYTGITGTSFTGCQGGAGTIRLNGSVVQTGESLHTEVNSIRMSDLASGTKTGTNLSGSSSAFQFDLFSDLNPNHFQVPGAVDTMRPTVMHDSVAGRNDPMWLVATNPADSASINIVKMSNVLPSATAAARFDTTTVTVNSYQEPAAPLQPDGTALSNGFID